MPTITLLTDFGLGDPYAGQMKGVLNALVPGAQVIDLSHDVPAFDLIRGSFFLEASRRYFSSETIFVCVVDPGVGGPRDVVCMRKFDQYFLAPDNGLLSLTLKAPGQASVVRVYPEQFNTGHISNTFHGRDIFAPAAAVLARGGKLATLGPAIGTDTLTALSWAEPGISITAPKRLEATVLHVDRFGNLILNIPDTSSSGGFPWPEGVTLSKPAPSAIRTVRTYAELEAGEIGLLAGSQGFLELSMNHESAAGRLGVGAGDNLVFEASGGTS